MEQPPAEREIPPIGLVVIPERLSNVILMVLEADRSGVRGKRGQGHDTGEVIPSAEKVELDTSEERQER